jgi:hypothetical protein
VDLKAKLEKALEDRADNLAKVWVREADFDAAKHDFYTHLRAVFLDGMGEGAAHERTRDERVRKSNGGV